MKALYELKEKFEMELEELARKGELGAGDLELAHKLTDTIKNIDKICALEEDGGYSEAETGKGAGLTIAVPATPIAGNTTSGATTPEMVTVIAVVKAVTAVMMQKSR